MINEEDEFEVVDEAEQDETVLPQTYDITSWGVDYDVEGLHKRVDRGDILIPKFQRDYVWSLGDASRFIESLLLGLPVPGIFMSKERETNKLLVIDGQQRLKTIYFFYKGVFNPRQENSRDRKFKLTGVQPRFEGKTFEELEEKDQVALNDSSIHATIIKQEHPPDSDTSIYHVFERLNTGGRKLNAQEIRSALYHGNLIDFIGELNDHESWRKMYGKLSNRMKDDELILRFYALYFDSDNYVKPMNEFLNIFCRKYRNEDRSQLDSWIPIFKETMDVIYESIGEKAFKPQRNLNAAVYDAVTLGVAYGIKNKTLDRNSLKERYLRLLEDENFKYYTSRATSDETSVRNRIQLAIEHLSK